MGNRGTVVAESAFAQAEAIEGGGVDVPHSSRPAAFYRRPGFVILDDAIKMAE